MKEARHTVIDNLFPRFSDSEYARRYNTIRPAMANDNLDAILISGARGSSEVAYLSNYQAQSPCWLLLTREGEATLFIHFFNHQPCAKAQSILEDVRWYGPTPVPTLVDEIKTRALSNSKIGLVSMRSMAYGHVTELQRQFPDAQFVEFGPQFGRIRRVRSEEELIYLRKSGYLTDLACVALENNLRPGLTEQDVLSIVYSAYLKNGGDPGILVADGDVQLDALDEERRRRVVPEVDGLRGGLAHGPDFTGPSPSSPRRIWTAPTASFRGSARLPGCLNPAPSSSRNSP